MKTMSYRSKLSGILLGALLTIGVAACTKSNKTVATDNPSATKSEAVEQTPEQKGKTLQGKTFLSARQVMDMTTTLKYSEDYSDNDSTSLPAYAAVADYLIRK